MLHTRTLSVLAATAALVTAGCGGDDDNGAKSTPAETALTPTAYVAKVKARCERYSKAREAAAKPIEQRFANKQPDQLTTGDMKVIAPVQRAVNATTASVIADVSAIPVPNGLRAARDTALAAARAGLADQQAAATAMAAGNRAAMLAAFGKSDKDFGSAEREGKKVGLSACE
jgi:hypothetical protein